MLQELEKCGSSGNEAIQMLLDKLRDEGLETHTDNAVGSPAQQLAQELSRCPASVAQGELCSSGILHGVQDNGLGHIVTMSPDVKDASDATSAKYVKFAAQAVAEWMCSSGIGAVKVQASGDILQAGAILARMIPTQPEGPALVPQASSSSSREWAWEVLWSGAGEDVPDLVALQEALSHVHRDHATS